jgi:hypothetical protein
MSSNPEFCQYASGACDQQLPAAKTRKAFFVYPSLPRPLAQTCKTAVEELQRFGGKANWTSWEELPISGQIVFCEICKALRSTEKVVGDITHLNFNVLFELGYSLGLRRPVIPVRDTSYKSEHLAAIGIFDVLGYQSFQNSKELVAHAQSAEGRYPFSNADIDVSRAQPIYYVKSPIESDGSIKILSCLKKGYFRFRVFDPAESPRLSLHEAYRQVMSSVGVVAHLMDPNRNGAEVHNGRAAFICGMAMAAERRVLMIQEGLDSQPIDYRDVVCHYDSTTSIAPIVERFLRNVAEAFQSQEFKPARAAGILEKLDLGDVAAENEIESLRKYFVKTPQYQQTIQGHTQIVVGRKGAGKTAIFYGIREALRLKKAGITLDLKPDGHQLIKLREAIVEKLTGGLQNHTLVVFWEYLLLLEIAKKVLDRDVSRAYSDPSSLKKYRDLESAYRRHATADEGDFSERILALVDRMIAAFDARISQEELSTADLTGLVHQTDIGPLRDAVLGYLSRSDEIWILFDNIDKGWPAKGTRPDDITIVRCLLDASRKVQRMFAARGQQTRTIIFLRKDVHDLLVDQTPDRGKDAAVNLEWSDPELIKTLLARRIRTSAGIDGDFDSLWMQICDPHIRGGDSFRYVLDRTFLRPRDVLNFARLSAQIALSRDHTRVLESDFLSAEKTFSEDMLNDLRHEIRDVFPIYGDILSGFFRSKRVFSADDLRVTLFCAEVEEASTEKVIDTLLWFSFLGVSADDEEKYSYQLAYNLERLKLLSSRAPNKKYVIHPAFHAALEIADS